MPTLLQINITANWGSTGKIAESIGQCAMSHGWDSYIAYGEVANPSKSHLIRIGSRMNQYLHFAEQRIFDNEGLCSRIVTRRFIETIKRIDPDGHQGYMDIPRLLGFHRPLHAFRHQGL